MLLPFEAAWSNSLYLRNCHLFEDINKPFLMENIMYKFQHKSRHIRHLETTWTQVYYCMLLAVSLSWVAKNPFSITWLIKSVFNYRNHFPSAEKQHPQENFMKYQRWLGVRTVGWGNNEVTRDISRTLPHSQKLLVALLTKELCSSHPQAIHPTAWTPAGNHAVLCMCKSEGTVSKLFELFFLR